MAAPVAPRRVGVFAVEPESAQVVWGRLGPGPVTLSGAGPDVTVEADGGPGSASLSGLAPGTDHRVHLHGPGVPSGFDLSLRTTTAPAGQELYRLATIGDLHLGIDHFGQRGSMREHPEPAVLHPVRCARAAVAEGVAWGAERFVAKGDLTDRGSAAHWSLFGDLLARCPVPLAALPGNHDAKAYRELAAADALDALGLPRVDPVHHVDLPGVRLILVDTAVVGHHHGTLGRSAEAVVELAAGRNVLVAMHHYPQAHPLHLFWPPGVPWHQARRFLGALDQAARGALLTSGHAHRHRRRRYGRIEITEVGSCKDYPGTWAGYVVHEGGIRQVVRRVARPDCMAWTEYTRLCAWGAWGRWSPGTLGQRCFSHAW